MILNTMTDHITEQRITTIITDYQMVRIREHCDGPATCVRVPANPRSRCIPVELPRPMPFDEAVTYCSLALQGRPTPFAALTGD